MPASVRAHQSRATPSRPYDCHSPTASPAQSENPYRPCSLTSASPIQPLDADIPPDHPGLPTYAEYKRIEAGYLHSLSPRKRDKALITQVMFDKIWDVLHQPEACTIETPQFRFWVRKMFTLSRPAVRAAGTGAAGTHALTDTDSDAEEEVLELERSMMRRFSAADELSFAHVVLHENRPVAIVEQLYEVFCYCHVRAGHGGRDKTCAVIREHYSWVPKELTAQFVKACPTCALKRSGQPHIAVGRLGVSMGMLARRQVNERGGRRRAMPLEMEAQGTPEPVEHLGPGWPTTGGPLDPANPEPCGVREREQLRAHRDAGNVSLTPMSSDYGSGAWLMPGEALLEGCSPGRWGTVLRALTLDSSPFFDPFATNNNNARQGDQETPKTGLPSLASALSNESLDENVNLTSLGPGGVPAAECPLPPVLRPLRLLGPASSDAESEARLSYPFQIDPLLLSFDYPELGSLHSEESFFAPAGDHAGGNGVGDATTTLPLRVGLTAAGGTAVSDPHGTIPNLASLRRSQSQSPANRWSPSDTSFERGVAPHATAPCGTAFDTSFSTELTTQRRCGSPYGHGDGPFGMVCHSSCSADEVGQRLERDGPHSFSTMND